MRIATAIKIDTKTLLDRHIHFKNLHVGTRLGMGFAAVLTLLALVTVTGFWSLHKDGELADRLFNDALIKERLITE